MSSIDANGAAAPSRAPRRLSFMVMLSYGIGQSGEALVTVGFNTFLLFYYNQVLKVSGTVTAIALAISLVVDAVIDPMAGALSDRLRSRFGRRHPYIALTALPLGFSFFMMFNPPAGFGELELALWLVAFTLLTRLALTFYTVPHLALGAEMAHDYNQRSTMYSFGTFFAFVGAAVGTAIAYRSFFPTTPQYSPGLLNPHGYLSFSIAFATAIVAVIGVCVAGTWREIPHLPTTGRDSKAFTLRQMLRETLDAFGNRSFRALFFGMCLSTLMLAAEGVLQPYITVHFWGLTTEQISTIPIFTLFGFIAGVLLIPSVTRWLDKKKTLMYCAYVSLVNGNLLIGLRLLHAPWIPANGSTAILVLVTTTAFIGAVMAPLVFGSLNAMFADIVDEHELETGHRREGIVFAARSFLIKAISSVGIIMGGWVIDWIRFPRGARAGTVDLDVLWNLGLFQAPLPSVFVLIAVFFYSRYQLDRKRHAEIIAALAERRVGADGRAQFH